MGYFGCLAICAIDTFNSVPEVRTQVLTFSGPVYNSWQRGREPNENWKTAGLESISFADGARIVDVKDYKLRDAIRVVKVGVVRKRTQYNFRVTYDLRADSSVFHVVLPRFCIPDSRSFAEDEKPQHQKRVGDRIALTWVFGPTIEVDFNFVEATPARFEKFPAAGVSIKTAISPGAKHSIIGVLGGIKEEGEVILAKIAAELLKLKDSG